MRRYRADWVLPIAAHPIQRGWIAIDEGRIVAVGDDEAAGEELGSVVLLPGLVNAHTHLELSYLQGEIPRAPRFGDWVRSVLAARAQVTDASDQRIVDAARRAIRDVRASGTALVGDVSNTLFTVPLLRESALAAHVFHELTGFTEPDPAGRVQAARARIDAAGSDDRVRVGLAPHAPYSVSANLFKAICADLDAHEGVKSSVHVGESSDELELLRRGSGDLRALLEELGRWPEGWRAPGVSPVHYLSDLGVLDSRTLVVHGTQFDGDDLTRVRAVGATLVACPRSNTYVGVGAPPLEAFYAMEVDVAFGTDSLASVDTLSMFDELAEARRLAPRVPASALLESATRVGAKALGFGADFGTLEPGRRADVIAVRVPTGVDDVEEYLVSGVPAEHVSWLSPGGERER